MAITAPNGYRNQLVSVDELHRRHASKMHPEFARRLFACIEGSGGLVGIGGGWRSSEQQAASYARDPNTFARPGSSFHETQHFASGIDGYAAVDTVGRDGENDRAWTWLRDHGGRFGLRTFWDVNGEPWHVQCNDIPAGVSSWRAAGSPDPRRFDLHVDAQVSRSERPEYRPHPENDDKPVVKLGWHGELVRYVQLVIGAEAGGRLAADGDFGPRTDARVKDLQASARLSPTGVVDWNGTWQFIDHLAGHSRPPARSDEAQVERVDTGFYWVQRGDSPWGVAERVYGRGDRYELLDPADPIAPGFLAADHHIRLPDVAGSTTVVQVGDRPWSLIGRLRPGIDPGSCLSRFYTLNGGEHRVRQPGDLVVLDDAEPQAR